MALHHLRTVQTAAPALGLTLLPVGVTGPEPEDIERSLAALREERPEAILVIPDPTFTVHQSRIAEFAVTHRLPTIGTYRSGAEGGL